MEGLTNIIGDPYFWGLISAYWVFSAAVGALQLPRKAPLSSTDGSSVSPTHSPQTLRGHFPVKSPV